MSEEKYLSVKDFAEAAEVSTQYIYKLVGNSLKPYVKKINKKTMINAAAIQLLKDGFNATVATNSTNLLQPDKNTNFQPLQSTEQPTNSTNFTTVEKSINLREESGEVQALKEMIEELKRDKEDLKKDKEQLTKDKEDLKQEALKWQQLLIDEKNKVKLLEAAKTEQQEDNIINIKEQLNVTESTKEEQEKKELHKGFFNKLKMLFRN